jgi:hypothetical protein
MTTATPAAQRETEITRFVQDALSAILKKPPDIGLEIARRLNDQLSILLGIHAGTATPATTQPSSIIEAPPTRAPQPAPKIKPGELTTLLKLAALARSPESAIISGGIAGSIRGKGGPLSYLSGGVPGSILGSAVGKEDLGSATANLLTGGISGFLGF